MSLKYKNGVWISSKQAHTFEASNQSEHVFMDMHEEILESGGRLQISETNLCWMLMDGLASAFMCTCVRWYFCRSWMYFAINFACTRKKAHIVNFMMSLISSVYISHPKVLFGLLYFGGLCYFSVQWKLLWLSLILYLFSFSFRNHKQRQMGFLLIH